MCDFGLIIESQIQFANFFTAIILLTHLFLLLLLLLPNQIYRLADTDD